MATTEKSNQFERFLRFQLKIHLKRETGGGGKWKRRGKRKIPNVILIHINQCQRRKKIGENKEKKFNRQKAKSQKIACSTKFQCNKCNNLCHQYCDGRETKKKGTGCDTHDEKNRWK